MSRRLFDIGKDLVALDDLIEERGGDVTDPEAEAAYAAKAAARAKRIAWLKRRMLDHLLMTRRTKAETATGRTNSVQQTGGAKPVVFDTVEAADVPERFRAVAVTIDKAAVKAALDAGEEVPFARYGELGCHLRIR